MPKIVDHDERRAQLTDALVRLAARSGLHSVTMRAVAAEAGVSLRLVQYYFHTKAQLMHAALARLTEQSNQRWAKRIAALAEPTSTRGYLRELLAEALPTDEPSRAFHLVWSSYAVLAMTDPELAAQPFIEGPNLLEGRLIEALESAHRAGELRPEADPSTEAARLLSINHGLATSVLIGQRGAAAAHAILNYHLDELFPDNLKERGHTQSRQDS
ncbi:TetR family transcriptional regulator [Tamaricihabitans halophyticus]|uniref:TetR family transcriptional regulator n=1 Tax=Tamaricihabitans halophyticus TaxID=1262583 RepID=A0A4V2SUN5_9PSEU|nr:TetR family transcriptional regulator C-terminal domain-containing protein [Tamaricihabitans halophyticus]TCP54826.1 TetR family transcriptional regulator [Tamaricihabitans halophyticus]